MIETPSKITQRVNFWAGFLGIHIVGPLLIDGNLEQCKESFPKSSALLNGTWYSEM